MRRRRPHVFTMAMLAVALLVGCETDDGEDVEPMDAEFEQLEDDSGDGEPLDEDIDRAQTD